MPDVTLAFTDDQWSRLEAALLAHSVVADTTTVAAWLRECLKNVIHSHEENAAYDTMKLAERTRQGADTF